MKRRWVPIPVDDPRVTHLSIAPLEQTTPDSEGRSNYLSLVGHWRVPVPPDDQIADDIDSLTRMAYAVGGKGSQEIADRLRAAFQLGEEE